jgi:PAS domain S-box-containing protein
MNDQPSDRAGLPARKPLLKRRRLRELQKEEAQFRAIFESAAFGIVLADAEGRPQECNPTLERMLGYTADELRTMRISDFTHPDDAEETERALKAVVKGELEHVHTEKRYVRKDGSLVWVNVIASSVLNTDGERGLSIAMIEDISARKSAEADTVVAVSARESAEADTGVARDYAADLIETAGAMIVGLDLNGDIELFNKAAEEITGYTSEELVGRNWFEIIVPQERYPAVRGEFERLLAGGVPQEYENPILTKSGEERYVVWRRTKLDDHGVIVGMVSIGIDVTELKRTEKTLRHERDFVAKIIDTSPIGIVAYDHQGKITFANAEAERILGLTRDEARHGYNAPDWPVTDYEGRPFPNEELPFRQVQATGRPVYDVRYAIENANGERVYLSINAAPALSESGEWDGMIASIDDVSKLTRADETRELLKAELLQSQKMEAVGKLATGGAQLQQPPDCDHGLWRATACQAPGRF